MIRDGYKQTTEHWKQYMLTSFGAILRRKTNFIWPDTKAILTVLLSKLSWKQRPRHDKHHFNTEKIYILPDKKIKLKRTFHGKKQQQQKILLRATILKIPDFVSAIYKCYSERKNGNNLTTSVKLKIDILTGFLFKMQKPKTDYACQIDKDPNKGHSQIFLACLKTIPPISQNITSMCN